MKKMKDENKATILLVIIVILIIAAHEYLTS